MNGGELRVLGFPRRDLLFLLALGGGFAIDLEAELSVVQKAVVEFAADVEGRLQMCFATTGRGRGGI